MGSLNKTMIYDFIECFIPLIAGFITHYATYKKGVGKLGRVLYTAVVLQCSIAYFPTGIIGTILLIMLVNKPIKHKIYFYS